MTMTSTEKSAPLGGQGAPGTLSEELHSEGTERVCDASRDEQ